MNNPENDPKRLIADNKCYKVILSTKTEVRCDKNEVQRLISGIKEGGIIKLKQGLINPSFIVAVVEDEERSKKFREEVWEIDRHNHQDREYHEGKGQRRLPSGVKSLADIFSGTKLTASSEPLKLPEKQ